MLDVKPVALARRWLWPGSVDLLFVMKITIWGDFACPFCYIGESMLAKVLNELKLKVVDGKSDAKDAISVVFKAYELDPEAPAVPVQSMTEHFMSGHEISEDDAKAQMGRISRMAERNGLSYNLEGVKICSTLDAHRLVKYAAGRLSAEELMKLVFAIFKANFTDNLLLSDRDVLAGLAADAGLNREEVVKMLATDEFTEEVRRDEKEADAKGLELIPYMVFDDKELLQGILSPGAIRKVITGPE